MKVLQVNKLYYPHTGGLKKSSTVSGGIEG
jgi:hypothetical protein